IERLCDRVLVVDRGMLAYDGTLPGLAATVGARRGLLGHLVAPTPDLDGIRGAEHLSSEGGGLRQRLAFDARATTAATLRPGGPARAEVRDPSIEAPHNGAVV